MIRLTALRVTLHFRSGRSLTFLTHKLVKEFTANELVRLEGDGTIGWPFYFRLDEIEAVVTRRVLKVRWLP